MNIVTKRLHKFHLRRRVRKFLGTVGYSIYRRGTLNDYTLHLPYRQSTYSPWFEDWFQKLYSTVQDHTIVTEDRCYIIYKFALHCLRLDGEFAECGVYKGGSAALISYTLNGTNTQDKRLHLFDTFTGIPATAGEDSSGLKPGEFDDASLADVKAVLREFPFVALHPGAIPATFPAVKYKTFALVHVDVVTYKATEDCCTFFYDRMVRGGVIIFDDYGFPGFKFGAKRAVDEFFADKTESPISLPTGQCIVIKS